MSERVYVSGGMSGIPEEEYKARFAQAERLLKERGMKVFNPCHWVWFLKYLPYKVALAFDLMMMCP